MSIGNRIHYILQRKNWWICWWTLPKLK